MAFLLYFLFNFFIYGFIGWVIENVYCYFIKGHFQKDGFLNSPFKPMYGIAMSILVVFSSNINTYLLLLLCLIIPTTVEYAAGLIMRRYFNKDYWDYSKEKYNVQGIICLKFSIYWTVLTFIGIRYFQIYIVNNIYKTLLPVWIIAAPVFILGLIIDVALTIRSFRRRSNIA